MKSEHRHELAENDLEVFINKLRARFAESMELNGNRIMLWTSAVLLLIAAVIFSTRSSDSANAQGWAALNGARSPEDLASVADDHQGKPVGQWARLNVGEQYVQSGLRLMFTDREAGITDLQEARDAFEAVLNEKKVSAAIRERAMFGLARVLETTSNGDMKPALDTYQKLTTEFPASPYKTIVEARVAVLEGKSTQEFYAWFSEQKPEPKDLELPKDFQGKFPEIIGTETLAGETPDEKMPAKEGEKKADSKNPAKPGPKLSAPDFPPVKNGKKSPAKPETTPKKEPTTKKADSGKPAPAKPEQKPAKAKPAPEKKEEAKPQTPPSAPEKKEVPKPEAKKPESGSK